LINTRKLSEKISRQIIFYPGVLNVYYNERFVVVKLIDNLIRSRIQKKIEDDDQPYIRYIVAGIKNV